MLVHNCGSGGSTQVVDYAVQESPLRERSQEGFGQLGLAVRKILQARFLKLAVRVPRMREVGNHFATASGGRRWCRWQRFTREGRCRAPTMSVPDPS